VFVLARDQRDPADDLDAVGAEPVDLGRVVRHQDYAADLEGAQHFGGHPVVSAVGLEAQHPVRLERVVAALLERVRADLVREADPASFLAQIEEGAGWVPRQLLERGGELVAAVAAK